jgi:hypothetical protein
MDFGQMSGEEFQFRGIDLISIILATNEIDFVKGEHFCLQIVAVRAGTVANNTEIRGRASTRITKQHLFLLATRVEYLVSNQDHAVQFN